MKHLYHGSAIGSLKQLNPFENGHNCSFVYAVANPVFAAIFANRPSLGSILADWGILENGTPFFCERKKGVFESCYNKKPGSIYVVNKHLFRQTQELWENEWISDQSVDVIKEIKIIDLKLYLLNLENQNKFKLILYKDRLSWFPDFDKNFIKSIMEVCHKYGSDKILPAVKKEHPQLFAKLQKTME